MKKPPRIVLNPSLEQLVDAVWDYMLEHSDLTQHGSFFIKFHAESKKTFLRRILARYRGYHRDDPRYPKPKAELSTKLKTEHKESKIKEKPKITAKQVIKSWLIRQINHHLYMSIII